MRMSFLPARCLLLAAILALGASTIMPASTAQSQTDFWNATERNFWLHIQQYCEPVSVIRFIDEFDWANDLDGCGGDVTDPAKTSWTDKYTAQKFRANVTSSTTAELHLFVLSRAVDQTSVSFTIDLGYAECKGSAPMQTLVQEKAGGFVEFKPVCTFEVKGVANELARPNLTTVVTATHSYGIGTESPHASYVKILGVEPAPPKQQTAIYAEGERPVLPFERDDEPLVAFNQTDNGTAAAAASPGLDSFAALAGVAGALVVVSVARRRERA